MIKKTYGTNLTTSEVTLYEVPAGKKTEWLMLYATNTGSANKKFNVRLYKASADTHLQMFDSYIVNTKDFFHFGGNTFEFVMLDEGDKILVSGDSNNDITLLVSVIEHNNIIQGG